MSVMDRVNRNRRTGANTPKVPTEAGSSPDSKSSTLAVRESPAIRRLKAVLFSLQKFIEENDESGMSRYSFLMTAFVDELSDELNDRNDYAIRAYLAQMGEVIGWVGHGDNSRLPDNLRVFAEAIQPSPPTAHEPEPEEVKETIAIP